MPRLESYVTGPSPYHGIGVAFFAIVLLGAMLHHVAAQTTGETLPRYGAVDAGSDSAAVVRAAADALQQRASVALPTFVARYETSDERGGRVAVVSLRPVPVPGLDVRGVGGTVRVLGDGRRVIVARE